MVQQLTIKLYGLICLLLCVISSACAQTEQSPEVKVLIDKTLKQMIFVEGGSFMMGDPGQAFADALGNDAFNQYFTSDDNVPIHKVTLDGYYMSAYEVTYGNYDVYSKVTQTPLACEEWRKFKDFYAAQKPVGISWTGAHNYCQWLAKETGLPFSLPTEAQWEYAARNRGKVVIFATNNGKIERGVNFPQSMEYPMNVGQFPPTLLVFMI